MTIRSRLTGTTLVFIVAAATAQAGPTVSTSTFLPGGAASQPDSITTGDGSVWVEYGNGADSTGASGSSTIVRYSMSGAVQHTYTIAGLVDGLKFNPVTGMVWALQNNDGNSTLSIINPTTNAVSPALMYASPSSSRGFDDVAFLNGKVYLSYTNPVNPTDPVVVMLNQGNSPSGTLTTTTILTAQQTNPLFTTPASSTVGPPDIDSLKSTPSGQLVLTTEGDAGVPGPQDGRFTLISNPGTASTVTNVPVLRTAGGAPVTGMDDVLFPGATAGTLYVADTTNNTVYAIKLTGLDPNVPIVTLGGLQEVALVDPTTGVVGMPLLTGLKGLHGLDFVPATVGAPEPPTWPMLLLGLGGLAVTAAARRQRGAASSLATAS